MFSNFLKIYLIGINILTFVLMGADKFFAKADKRRISEKTFVVLSILGGSVGVILGIYAFRHKTRKPKFTVLVPIILVTELALVYFIVSKLY